MVAVSLKNTEIGMIPEDWEIDFLSSVIEKDRKIKYGVVQPGEYCPDGCLMLRSQDYSKGWKTPVSMHRVNSLIEKNYISSKIKPNDLIITIVGAGIAQVEIAPRWLEGGLLSRSTARVAVDGSKGDFRFIYQILSSDIGYKQILYSVKEGAQPVVSALDLGNCKIPLPPLPEQKAIAEALSDADIWIANLEQLIAKKRLIKRGAMQQLLSPKEDWEVKKLGEVGFFIPTNSFSRDALNYSHGSVYNIHYGDIHTKFRSHFNVCRESVPFINQNILNNKQITACKEGDLIIADASENETDIGKAIEICFLNDLKVVSGLHTIHFRPLENRFRIGFLGFVFQSLVVHEQILKEAQGTKVLGISTSRIKEVAMSVPPLTEQNRITTILSDMDNEIESLENQLAKSTQIKQGMMQELLTGRVRLV